MWAHSQNIWHFWKGPRRLSHGSREVGVNQSVKWLFKQNLTSKSFEKLYFFVKWKFFVTRSHNFYQMSYGAKTCHILLEWHLHKVRFKTKILRVLFQPDKDDLVSCRKMVLNTYEFTFFQLLFTSLSMLQY